MPKSSCGKHRPPKKAEKEAKAPRGRAWRDAWRKAYQHAVAEDEILRLAIEAEEDEARAWHDAEVTRHGRDDAGGAFIVPMKLIGEYLCRRFDAHARWNRLYIFREEQLDEWGEFLSWLKADLLGNFLEMLSTEARRQNGLWWKVDSRLEARVAYWRAQGAQRVLERSLSSESPAPAERPASPAAEPSSAGSQSTRAAVDDFIGRVLRETGRKITRTDIWKNVAGYTDRTEFQRFQRGEGTTATAARNFTRVLSMAPKDFIEALDRKKKPAPR